MTPTFPLYHNGTIAIWLPTLLVLVLLAGGCTQPDPQHQQRTMGEPEQVPAPVSAVTAVQTDSSHITVTYPGSTSTDTLLELEVTVTDSAGKTQTKSMGSRLSTTPLQYGATLTLTGTFNGNDRMIVTGYFMNSSPKLMLDTTIRPFFGPAPLQKIHTVDL